MIEAHDQTTVNHYVMHYLAHHAREGDPYYPLFNAFHRKHSDAAVCHVGHRLGYDQCADAKGKRMIWQRDPTGHSGLELHHSVLEFATLNSVNLKAVMRDFPDLTSMEKVLAWAESEPNFMWLCAKHHRGPGGIHHAAAADWEAELYIRNLIGPFVKRIA